MTHRSILLFLLLGLAPCLAQTDSKLLFPDRSDIRSQEIRLLDAVYGQDERTCDASRSVASECDGRAYCEVMADDRLCGNPYRNVSKELFVSWTCGDGRRTLTVAEGEPARIYCTVATTAETEDPLAQPPRNWQRGRVYVAEASYGVQDRSCDFTAEAARACDGQSRCSLEVNNRLCGDPAEGRRKSAELAYWCNGTLQRLSVPENRNLLMSCP